MARTTCAPLCKTGSSPLLAAGPTPTFCAREFWFLPGHGLFVRPPMVRVPYDPVVPASGRSRLLGRVNGCGLRAVVSSTDGCSFRERFCVYAGLRSVCRTVVVCLFLFVGSLLSFCWYRTFLVEAFVRSTRFCQFKFSPVVAASWFSYNFSFFPVSPLFPHFHRFCLPAPDGALFPAANFITMHAEFVRIFI